MSRARGTRVARVSPFEDRREVLIPGLATFLDVELNDKGPVVVDWMLEDFRILSDPEYWWDSPFVLTYSHCLAWVLRKMNLNRVLVDVSFGIPTNSNTSFGPPDVEKYANIDMVIAPSYLGHRAVGHWGLIVIDKRERTVSVTSSTGTVNNKPEHYNLHYNRILRKTGWVEPSVVVRRNRNETKTRPRTRTRRVVREEVVSWHLDFLQVDATGPQCGKVMCNAFRDQVAVLVAGAAANVRDTDLARSLASPDEFGGNDNHDAFKSFHHMCAILNSMVGCGDIALCDSDISALTGPLYGMSGRMFRVLMEEKLCHCGDLCDLTLRSLVGKVCCNRRHHARCFVNEMRTAEASPTLRGRPFTCSYCFNTCDEIVFIPVCYQPLAENALPALSRCIRAVEPVRAHNGGLGRQLFLRQREEREARESTTGLRQVLMQEIELLAPGPENYQVTDLTEPSPSPGPDPVDLSSPTPGAGNSVDLSSPSPAPSNEVAAVLEPEGANESDGASVRASATRAPRNIADDDSDEDDAERLLGLRVAADEAEGERSAAERERQEQIEVAAQVENNAREEQATRDAEAERRRELRASHANARALRLKAEEEQEAREEEELVAAEAAASAREVARQADIETARQVALEESREAEAARDAARETQRIADEEHREQEQRAEFERNEARLEEEERRQQLEADARSRARQERRDRLERNAAQEHVVSLEGQQHRNRLAERAQAAARGRARSNQRREDGVQERERVDQELRAVNREVHGGVPLSVDMGDPGDQSTLASPGPQPQLHQESQDTVGGDGSADSVQYSEASENIVVAAVAEPPISVYLYSEVGGVGEKIGSSVWVFKFGCMAFAAIGETAASGLAVHRELSRLFVEPAPLRLACPTCNAVAPSAVVLYWHMLSGCGDVTTPFQCLWHASLPLFFLVTADVLKAMTCAEQWEGQPVDLLDPSAMPAQNGANVAHRSKRHNVELVKERSLMGSVKKSNFWSVVQRKLTWIGQKPRRLMLNNMPELLCYAFLKPAADWPNGVLNECAERADMVPPMDVDADDIAVL